jgi:hypothetical protein
LATGRKTPLSEAAPETPGRAKKTTQRSKVVRRRAIVGGAVAVVLVGGAILLAVLGGKGPLVGIVGSSTPPVPPFHFKVAKVVPVTTTKTRAKRVLGAVKPIANDVKDGMDTLYMGTFVNPDVWDGDHYDKVFNEVMDGAAKDEAANQIDGLTLGADAGSTYESVQPGYSKLTIKVLTDPNDNPTEAIALVSFQGLAKHDDGTYSKVFSTGSYFFKHEDGGWKIFAFKVARNEKKAKAPASATASSGATSS